jgi:hypothetical protein
MIPISHFWKRSFSNAIKRNKMAGLRYMVALGTRVTHTHVQYLGPLLMVHNIVYSAIQSNVHSREGED